MESFGGRVTNISLWSNNLSGELPDQIGDLEELKYLSLSYNDIKGKLPSTIGKLKKLAVVDITQAKLSGEIPKEIENCKNLYWLFLSNNQLEGNIPEGLGTLQKLEWAFLDYNKLSGPLPQSIKNCENLEWLNLNYNRINFLPDLNGSKRIFDLNVQKNKLTFEHLEPNLSFFPFTYFYEQQDSLGEAKVYEMDPGTTLSLDGKLSGNSLNNRYQWFKDGKAITGLQSNPELTVKNIPPGYSAVYNCAITNTKVEDLTLWTLPIKVKAKTPKVIVRVNAGGKTNLAASPVNWDMDSKTSPSSYLVSNSSTLTEGSCYWPNRANKTGAPDCIFGSFRTDWGKEGLKYEIPLKNGNYLVTMFFAEKDNSFRLGPQKAGDHVQDIYIENNKVLASFDMFKENGYNAIRKYFNIWVEDGKLSLNLKGVKGSPFLNGFEIALIKESEVTLTQNNLNIQEMLEKALLSVYPNPIHGNHFTVNLAELTLKDVAIKVYDQFGNTYLDQKVSIQSQGKIQVNLESIHMKTGVYFVKISSPDGSNSGIVKVIKE